MNSPSANFLIQRMLPEHWPAVRESYREGIASGNATFETELPDWDKWDAGHHKNCRLAALNQTTKTSGGLQSDDLQVADTMVLGWAALSPVSARRVYAGVAEVSVYVAASARGRGIGKSLLQALVHESEVSGIWTLQAGIFPENSASIALHKSWIPRGRLKTPHR